LGTREFHPRVTRPKRANRYSLDNWVYGCQQNVIIAPLWVAYQTNLGTLARTCDAVGACLAIPDTPHYRSCLTQGDTLGTFKPCIHWVEKDKEGWLQAMRAEGWHTVAVELDQHSIPVSALTPQRRSIVLLGHEHKGVPKHIIADADMCVEIPMMGVGRSLNVAVAGSLIAYRLTGLM